MSLFLFRPRTQCLRFLKTSTSTSLLSETVQCFMNTYGFSLKIAVTVSDKLRLELESGKNDVCASEKLLLEQKKIRNLDSVLTFLKSHGFSKAHVENFIISAPFVFRIKVDGNLQPKIQFFLDMGFSISDVADIIVLNPFILKRSLNNYLRPSFTALTKILQTNDRIMKVLKRWKWLISFDFEETVIPNVAVLIDEGVPAMALSRMISRYPRIYTQKQEKFSELVQWVKELGLRPNSSLFVYALIAKFSLSSQNWQKKIKMMKSLGLSEEEVMIAFRKAPFIVVRSEEKICKVVDFCVNTMKLEPTVLCTYPALLMYNFEERIVPRYAVIEVLKSKKLMTSRTFLWAFGLSEKSFMDRFVTKYFHEVQGLMEVYQRAKLGGTVGRTEVGQLGGM